VAELVARLSYSNPALAVGAVAFGGMTAGSRTFACTDSERIRLRVSLDVLVGGSFGLDLRDMEQVLFDCDHPRSSGGAGKDPKGFWRVDQDKDPELRHTVLTLLAFRDLEQKIHAHGGDRRAGIDAFLSQNGGEGWMLPETLRLSDYGLGHDERAQHPQPVASRLGRRFYDWQLAQTAEESWRECRLHARNLLGEDGFRELTESAERTGPADGYRVSETRRVLKVAEPTNQHWLFD
jgi:hypothetical protein